jgi:ethanolamine utilization protein EutN
MIVARVMGSVTTTRKHPALVGRTLLVVRPEKLTDDRGEKPGESFLAIDLVQAGKGDRVLVIREGSSCRDLVGDDMAPIHAAIVGIVDEVDVGGEADESGREGESRE